MPNYKFNSSCFSFSMSFVYGPRLLFPIVSKSLFIIHVSPAFGTLNFSAGVAQTLISQQLYLFRHVTLVTRCVGKMPTPEVEGWGHTPTRRRRVAEVVITPLPHGDRSPTSPLGRRPSAADDCSRGCVIFADMSCDLFTEKELTRQRGRRRSDNCCNRISPTRLWGWLDIHYSFQ